MKLFNFTIIKLTLYLVAGILIGYFINLSLKTSLYLVSISFLLLSIAFFILKNKINKTSWFGVLGFLTMISIGILNSSLHDDRQFTNHYSNVIKLNDSLSNTITLRIREVLKPSNYHDKYIIDVLVIGSKQVFGKSLLNVNKDSTLNTLSVDDIIIVKTQLNDLISSLNPYQFDYKVYLEKQQVYHQIFVTNSELITVSTNKHTIFGYAAKLRDHVQSKILYYNFSADEYAIISALLLGQRQDISKEVYDSYAQAGAIHILAVSGLHVGIILILLNYVLKPLELLKRGKFMKISIIVTLLWCFAIIAGLSASVTRAVTMFTIIAIAMHLKRQTNIYNTLAISVFVLLLFKPNFLFDVGFQLSYLAVLAIVILQPLLYKLWLPKYKVFDFFWKIFTVTLAAQFGVIPLSLYYFHQFPGLFFLSNLVIIPFLGIILGLGILVIILSSFSILPKFMADTYSFIISSMNSFIQWISNQEAFLLQNISFSLIQTILSYVLLATFLVMVIRKTYKSILALLIFVIITQLCFIYILMNKKNNEFIIFHKSRYTIIGFKNNDVMEVHHNLNDSIFKSDKTLTNYKVGAHLETIRFDSIQNVYKINNKMLLVIDSLGIYKSLSYKPQIILLRNSPKINLSRLIDSLQPELVISDGSNYKSYQERWKATCEAKKIPFHRTSEKGAYIYNY
ncbi:MAG: competence protein [Bacteroidetes bacterium]|nr:MAG: competence protein [Bacteroidota bacterium]